MNEQWNDKYIETEEQKWFDAAAKPRNVLPAVAEGTFDDRAGSAEKRGDAKAVVNLFKDHPAMGCWKGADEPEWGSEYIEPMQHMREQLRKLDPDHPIWIVQAPMGTVDSLREYNDDDGHHRPGHLSDLAIRRACTRELPNHEISLVGDHTRIMQEVVQGEKPIWMTLQIAWSGVAKEGRMLRMPTLAQERFMAYEAIINGARGLIWFGGSLSRNAFTRRQTTRLELVLVQCKPPPAAGGDRRKESAVSGAGRARVGDSDSLPADGNQVRRRERGSSIAFAKSTTTYSCFACNRDTATLHVNFSQIPPIAIPMSK